jgi:hypothetical protein
LLETCLKIQAPVFYSAIIQGLGPVAQLVEQRIENPRVDGSIPSQATKQKAATSLEVAAFLLA